MIKLGDRAKDKITGFKGIVGAICKYLNGCTRMGILSEKLDKDGKPPDCIWFDEPQIELIVIEVKEKGRINGGGPTRSLPENRTPK